MLKQEIIELIRLKQEGPYWDFKKEWYPQNKKADLLHDIICMANNLENKDGYIIIGVDEQDDYKLNSVEDDINRKKQMIVDFKDKKFVRIRPTVYVETITVEDKDIDVIVIKIAIIPFLFNREVSKYNSKQYIYSCNGH